MGCEARCVGLRSGEKGWEANVVQPIREVDMTGGLRKRPCRRCTERFDLRKIGVRDLLR